MTDTHTDFVGVGGKFVRRALLDRVEVAYHRADDECDGWPKVTLHLSNGIVEKCVGDRDGDEIRALLTALGLPTHPVDLALRLGVQWRDLRTKTGSVIG